MTWYYVDPENGTAIGVGTEADPARSLSTLSISAGDIIHFKKGTTYRAEYDLTASGTAIQPIIFRSYGTGAKPIIDAADICKGFILYGSDVIDDGGFEAWDTSATPDSPWIEDASSSNDVLQETSEMFMGSSCAKLVLAEDDDCQVYQAFASGEIDGSSTYRLAFASKSDVIGGQLRYKIVRDPAGSPYYWDGDSDQEWVTAETWNTLDDTTTLEYQRFSIDFTTESADAAYQIHIGPVTDETDNWGNYYLDAVACGKVAGDTTNLVGNWLFDND